MRMNLLETHLWLLLSADIDFCRHWAVIGRDRRTVYLRLLFSAEGVRHGLQQGGLDLSSVHESWMNEVGRKLDGLTEFEPEPIRSTADWVDGVHDREGYQRLFNEWWLRMKAFMIRVGGPGCALYGGLKAADSIQGKIIHYEHGCGPLDLYDIARLRLVFPHLPALVLGAFSCRTEFARTMVRFRNYYARPRGGQGDSYRAFHILFRPDGNRFVELQLLSAARDAIGLMDHTYILKRRMPFQSREHEIWLRQLSRAANLIDAADLLRCGTALAVSDNSARQPWNMVTSVEYSPEHRPRDADIAFPYAVQSADAQRRLILGNAAP